MEESDEARFLKKSWWVSTAQKWGFLSLATNLDGWCALFSLEYESANDLLLAVKSKIG